MFEKRFGGLSMNARHGKAELAAATLADARWARVLAKDRAADGSFFYGVHSTGVYCRPSCAARPARPENVSFHETADAAEQAGFRPCKRCKPDQLGRHEEQADLIAQACSIIEQAEVVPGMEQVAAQLGMSVSHFHRLFKQQTGLTPRSYARAGRARRMREQLSAGNAVGAAIYEAGYQSASRFYETADAVLGMTASNWQAGGAGVEIRFAVGQCALGAILVAHSGRGVCAILIGDEPQSLVDDLQDRFRQASLIGGDADFEQWVARVVAMVERPGQGLALPLDVRGTAFQQSVWQALREIAPGQTVTYAELARRIGAPGAVRAVGSACGANPVAIAIPCHRVVRSDGGLSGYRWGIERKRALIALEANQAAQGESE
jgi:AraC family transcriptional regulator of adaptative response/methylated-DNA-[protein]-cysteine methyltransferase